MNASFCCDRFRFFHTKPTDWLGETSPKWPILCWVGRETTTQSSCIACSVMARHPAGRCAAEHPMATRYWLIAVGMLWAPSCRRRRWAANVVLTADKGGSADLDTISFFTFHCLVMAFFSGRGAHNFTVHRNCLNTLESGPDHYVIWVFHVTDAVIILYCFAHVVYVFVCCWTRSLLAVAGGSCLYIVLIIT